MGRIVYAYTWTVKCWESLCFQTLSQLPLLVIPDHPRIFPVDLRWTWERGDARGADTAPCKGPRTEGKALRGERHRAAGLPRAGRARWHQELLPSLQVGWRP